MGVLTDAGMNLAAYSAGIKIDRGPDEPVSKDQMHDSARSGSDKVGKTGAVPQSAEPVPASRARPKNASLPRTLVTGQVGIVLITLGLMLTLSVFISLNFHDVSKPDPEQVRQVLRVIASALLVAGLVLVGFLTVPSHKD